MKFLNSITLFITILAFTFTGCKEDKPAETGSITFTVANEVDGQPIQLGQMAYTNAAGNQYRVDLLKYYISNFTLIKDDSTEYNIGNHDLIDAADAATCTIDAKNIPNGNYIGLRITLGIDSVYNHTGDQEGDLNPMYGMLWTWNTGYIFFKHEGSFVNSSSQTQNLLFHYGTDKARTNVYFPLQALQINGNMRKINLLFNLNTLYATPNVINFNVNNNHQSSGQADASWLNQMKANFAQSFSVKSVE